MKKITAMLTTAILSLGWVNTSIADKWRNEQVCIPLADGMRGLMEVRQNGMTKERMLEVPDMEEEIVTYIYSLEAGSTDKEKKEVSHALYLRTLNNCLGKK